MNGKSLVRVKGDSSDRTYRTGLFVRVLFRCVVTADLFPLSLEKDGLS